MENALVFFLAIDLQNMMEVYTPPPIITWIAFGGVMIFLLYTLLKKFGMV